MEGMEREVHTEQGEDIIYVNLGKEFQLFLQRVKGMSHEVMCQR